MSSLAESFVTWIEKLAYSFPMPDGTYKDGRPKTKKTEVLKINTNASTPNPAYSPALDPMRADQFTPNANLNKGQALEQMVANQSAAGRRPVGENASTPVPASGLTLDS